jgi:hypothetical protein
MRSAPHVTSSEATRQSSCACSRGNRSSGGSVRTDGRRHCIVAGRPGVTEEAYVTVRARFAAASNGPLERPGER